MSSCIGNGNGGGCCDETGAPCSSIDGSCYCDKFCHGISDCCGDIEEIGCSGRPK